MQWAFLVLAALAALIELNTGTFYLAGVAVAALLTTLIGFWLRDDWLIFVFLLLCALLTVAVMLFRRNGSHGTGLVDFDIGQVVSVCGISPYGHRLTVTYRGVNWEAVTDDGSVLVPGDTAVIVRKTDKLLHLALPPAAAAPTQPAAENDI